MRLGLTEIILIGLVIFIIVITTRMRTPSSRQPANTSQRQLTATEARDEEILRSRRSRGKIFGIVLIVIGVLLIVAAPNLIKAFFMSYLWGGLIIVAGLASLYFMSRRS